MRKIVILFVLLSIFILVAANPRVVTPKWHYDLSGNLTPIKSGVTVTATAYGSDGSISDTELKTIDDANIVSLLADSANAVAGIGRDFSTQAFAAGEAQATVSAAHILGAKYITNVGGAAETDLILTAVSYYISNTIIDTEGIGYEICPPGAEAIYLDGTALTATHCIDAAAGVGATATLTRQQIADDSYAYYLWSVFGTFADGNDTGD